MVSGDIIKHTMAKDYFQDIVPPQDVGDQRRANAPAPHAFEPHEGPAPTPPPPDRSIRNINFAPRGRAPMSDMRGAIQGGTGAMGVRPVGPRRGGRSWLWILTGVSVLALVILLALFVFKRTTVSVIPQSQPVVFDQSTEFTAYPQVGDSGTSLTYTVQSSDFEDSESVPSSGTQRRETKASGSITVVNNYSAAPVRLIKNTRFATATGLIFKAPAEILVPGKQGSSPGKVSVTVVADQVGAAHNIGTTARFTLPGLESNAAMHRDVYAYSSASTTGGFSGDQPGVAESDLSAAVAKVRARLQEKAKSLFAAQNSEASTVLTYRVQFTDMPNTAEAAGTVRIHQAARVEVAVVPSDAFSSIVAQTVAANVENGTVRLVPKDGFTVELIDANATWGNDPIDFTLKGQAEIVWVVDTEALAAALAGRNSQAFQTIVSNFPGVQSARARIEPFWERTFPSKASDIHITVEVPQAAE